MSTRVILLMASSMVRANITSLSQARSMRVNLLKIISRVKARWLGQINPPIMVISLTVRLMVLVSKSLPTGVYMRVNGNKTWDTRLTRKQNILTEKPRSKQRISGRTTKKLWRQHQWKAHGVTWGRSPSYRVVFKVSSIKELLVQRHSRASSDLGQLTIENLMWTYLTKKKKVLKS